ncbi:proline--tRNA ligase [Anaerotardibacter muris]|uniref:proline--tRNA ligase n=1 Tax=Anaerotardibacter muris TaxID=2941505 RepID=UPI00203A7227|nr:proline--tRNA ligase [Anaerotardibacter muris]
MSEILYMSSLYAPTLKEDPADAEIASHKLLMRAGMIRKVASGIYAFLPLGMRVLTKIENIVREEMNATGAQEILMPALQPSELWLESGRWDDYGPELMRLNDRHDHGFCLGPTHEELITALVRNELRSYRQLPTTLYQIQTKYRDEIRPRFGLLRSREFIMKDAYSFHANAESLQETYDQMSEAYGIICDRCGLDYRPVEADSGQIGGKVTTEFMALADAGEAELVYCPSCDYAANTEVAECITRPLEYPAEAMEKIATPGVTTIAALAEFLGCSEAATVKALVGKNSKGQVIAVFIPGDHELNELKISRVFEGFELLTDEELKDTGLPKGSIGPVGVPEGIIVAADRSLEDIKRWVVGANEDGFHYVGAAQDEDFKVDVWADLSTTKPGDICPVCGAKLDGARGIEVSQVFQLGDKYSKALGAVFSAEDGTDQPFLMGCYGVGVSRTMAAVVEQHNDENGIIWPASVAPAHVCIIPLTVGDDEVYPTALRLAQTLKENFPDLEIVIDDRDERPGVKFADADLIGWPAQIVVGKRGLKNGTVEVKRRSSGEKTEVKLDSISDGLAFLNRFKQSRTGRTPLVH